MTHQILKIAGATAALIAMAGCLGGGSGGGGAGSGAGGGASDNKAALEELQSRTVFETTDIADLPDSGTATYTGFVQLADVDNDVAAIQGSEVVGTATFEVGFAGDGAFTGEATNFQDSAGSYDGTLTIGNGGFGADPDTSNGARVTGDIAGDLTRETGEEIGIEGTVIGRFFDDGGTFLVGSSNDVEATYDGNTFGIEAAIHGEKD